MVEPIQMFGPKSWALGKVNETNAAEIISLGVVRGWSRLDVFRDVPTVRRKWTHYQRPHIIMLHEVLVIYEMPENGGLIFLI